MDKNISANDLRASIGDALDAVRLRGDRYIIERRGKPVAVLVPMSVHEADRSKRRRVAQLMETVAEQARMSEEEAMDFALREVAAARAEKDGQKDRAE